MYSSKCLSYQINKKTRFYKANTRDIENIVLDTSEKFNRETKLHIDSHTGTHIDYPAHSIKDGKFGEEYPIDYLCSDKVQMIEIDLSQEESPTVSLDFVKTQKIYENTEILLINTYFHKLRDDDRYIWTSPVIDSKIPLYLKECYPSIKAVGFDVISVTSQLDRDEGKRCHYNFLSNATGREVLIIEDIDYSLLEKESEIEEVIILPLMFEKMDGAPCTIMAKIKSK